MECTTRYESAASTLALLAMLSVVLLSLVELIPYLYF